MNEYFDAFLQLENRVEELGMLLDANRLNEALKKIGEIEVQLHRLQNYAWRESEGE